MTPAEQLAYVDVAHGKIPYLIDLLSWWEAMDAATTTDTNDNVHSPSLFALRDQTGVAEIRELCIATHPYVDQVWKAYESLYGEDSFGGAFDWEFCPLLVKNIDWSQATYGNIPGTYRLTVAELPAPQVMAKTIHDQWDISTPEPEVDLGERIQKALDTDDTAIDGARIAATYEAADEAGKALIDDVMTSMCGWTVKTLLDGDPD